MPLPLAYVHTCTKKILVWLSRSSFRRSKYHVLRSGESGIWRGQFSSHVRVSEQHKRTAQRHREIMGGKGSTSVRGRQFTLNIYIWEVRKRGSIQLSTSSYRTPVPGKRCMQPVGANSVRVCTVRMCTVIICNTTTGLTFCCCACPKGKNTQN